eukprot:TRINITY_DN132_c0_g1_i3.p1 TRINITY_DN132_c0_g1~~TRINITY_DN132_c0_g1_i3.p1  ORF type:complete len:446 (-),score=95.27 TRINITY_DN132_c0_g1_i3:688-2025(-)
MNDIIDTLGSSPEIKLGKSLEYDKDQAISHLLGDDSEGVTTLKTQEPAKCRIFEFQSQETSGFSFSKKQVVLSPLPKSLLSSLLGPVQFLVVTVTISVPDHKVVDIQVKIPQSSQVSQLILASVKQYNKSATLPLVETIESYVIKTAFNQVLPLIQSVSQISSTQFLLEENPESKKVLEDQKIIRVNLPNGNYMMASFHPTRRVSSILPEICEKRRLDPFENILLYKNEPVTKELTISQLEDCQLSIVQSSEYKGLVSVPSIKSLAPTTGEMNYRHLRALKRYIVYFLRIGRKALYKQELELIINVHNSQEFLQLSATNPTERDGKVTTYCLRDIVSCQMTDEDSSSQDSQSSSSNKTKSNFGIAEFAIIGKKTSSPNLRIKFGSTPRTDSSEKSKTEASTTENSRKKHSRFTIQFRTTIATFETDQNSAREIVSKISANVTKVT